MKQSFLTLVMSLLPKRTLSYWVGRFVHYTFPPPLAKLSVQLFANMYHLNMAEAEFPLEHYSSIGELFVRRLKPGARPIGAGPVHPADALISESGAIAQHTLVQCKGRDYTLTELLVRPQVAQRFEHGSFVTYYLCPTDYHRVHAPVDGEVVWSCHVPGERWPVNQWSVRSVARLFCVNERVITLMRTPQGHVAVVMVAATNVGNITMSYDDTIATTGRSPSRPIKEQGYQPPKPLRRGDELGIFHMGSTVIVLFEPGMLLIDIGTLRGSKVKMGESLLGPHPSQA